MYSPSAFSINDPSVIRKFVQQNSFGVLVSGNGEHFHDTHTPLLISEDLTRITGHIARANRQWQFWADRPSVKVIFHGPHSYISPRFYKSEFNVPTWNYSAISIDGKIKIIEDRPLSMQIVQDLISKYEGPSGWKLNQADERYMKLFDAIICFSIEVEKIDAKFKLNQNKSEEDKQSVISHLFESSQFMDHQTAELMNFVKGIK
jgi:transcriptional regulator